MHIQTHMLSGWCLADFFNLTPRGRLFAMIAATAADADGLGILVSVDCYAKYHHLLGHNFLFGILVAALLAAMVPGRLKAFGIFLALFHLHLVLDYFGSGPAWGFLYFWPFSDQMVQNPRAWELASWQNVCVAAALIVWAVVIACKRGRTPLEVLMPVTDRKVVEALRRNLRRGQ